jgi:hypothetical protein
MEKYKITGDGKNVVVEACNMVTAIENLGYEIIRTMGIRPIYNIEVKGTSYRLNNVILTPVVMLKCEWLTIK